MATYENNLRIKEIVTGDEEGSWGDSNNLNLSLITDAFGRGTKQMAANANETFTIPNAAQDATRSLFLRITSAVALTATRTVTLAPNTVSKVWIIENATTGAQVIEIAQGSGAKVAVPPGYRVMVVTDGAGSAAAVYNANPTVLINGALPASSGGTGLTAPGDEDNVLASTGTAWVSRQLRNSKFQNLGNVSGAVSIDLSKSSIAMRLTGNTTFTFTNPPPSGYDAGVTLDITQDGTGNRVITWPSSVRPPGGVMPPQTLTPNSRDVWTLYTNNSAATVITSLSVKGA